MTIELYEHPFPCEGKTAVTTRHRLSTRAAFPLARKHPQGQPHRVAAGPSGSGISISRLWSRVQSRKPRIESMPVPGSL
jgi:hypothetical protein